MKHASSLPEWKKNVVEFLSSRRKYRLFGWEFGPTLLDELYRIRDYRTDYIRVGVLFTPMVAFSAGLVSFVSTRRVNLAAAVTSSLILLGIVTTLAVDYQMTKRKTGVVSQEDCVELLKALGKTPQYWWWPWSKQIENTTITEKQINRAVNYNDYSITSRLIYSLFTNVGLHQLYVARLNYLYNYHKLGGKMLLGFDVTGSCKKLLQSNNLISSDEKVPKTAQREENRLEETSRIDKLVRTIYRVDNKEMSLSQALDLLQAKWMLLYLDKSLGGVRNKTKSEEEHNKYFESLVKQLMKLSLTYHSDKGKAKDDGMQKTINQTIKALRNIHLYIMQDETFILNKECYLLYRIYNRIPLSTLSSGEKDVSRVVKISSIDGMSALFELSLLADKEEEFLMKARNRYLRYAKTSVTSLCNKLLAIKNIKYNDIKELNSAIEITRKIFDNAYNKYVEEYYKHWVNYLESLNARCEKSELLEVIKEAVEKLLKESEEQYEMLVGQSYGMNPEENFVLPILDYFTLIEAYYEFTGKLLKDKEDCYSFHGCRSNQGALDKISSILEESKEEVMCEPSCEESKKEEKKLSYKDNIKEDKLSYRELLTHTRAMVNAYVKDDGNELNEEVKRSYKESKIGKIPTKEEIGNVIVFMLKHLKGLLDNRFQEKKTAFQRQEEEFKQLKMKRIKKEGEAEQEAQRAEQEAQRAEQEAQRAEQEAQRAEQEAQRAEQEAQRAEQEAQRANLIEEVEDLFTERIFNSDIDDELRKVILKDQRKIKREIVKHVMEHHAFPGQVLNKVVEEIILNKDQVLRNGAISDELIEVGIRNFLTINEVVEEMVEKVVIEVDNSTVLQDMQEEQRRRVIDLMYSRFKVPEKIIMENQDVQGNLEQQCIFLVLNEDYAIKFRNICCEYKNIMEVLKSKQVVGKEEFDKLSELANEFDRLSKNFVQREHKENEPARKFDEEAINELRSHVIAEIRQARKAAGQEREALIEEKNAVEEIVMQLQRSDSVQTPSSAFSSISHEPVAGPSWRI